MEKAHEKVVEAQFGPRAKAYVESAVHAKGPDLEALEAIVREIRPRHALDLGAGGGHVAYTMARHATRVTASDMSSEMLAAVAAAARDRGLANIDTVQAVAEHLPFDDASFDFLACRYTAHHWRDFEGGLRQARRVLARGSRAVFMDAYAPGTALLDTHLQAIELLRDMSHVRNYTAGEWIAALNRSGFAVAGLRTFKLRLEFANWTARMRTPDENMRAIRALQTAASAEIKTHFAIEADGSFLLDTFLVDVTAG